MNPRCVRCRAEIDTVKEPRCHVVWFPPGAATANSQADLCFACSGVLQPADADGEHMLELVGEPEQFRPNPRIAALGMAIDHLGPSGTEEQILDLARRFADFLEPDRVVVAGGE